MSKVGRRAVEVEVIVLDVRDDRDLRVVDDERAVALVGLDDEDLALARCRVDTEPRDVGADRERRLLPRRDEGGRRHSARRRLAVGARDGEPATRAHEHREAGGALLVDNGDVDATWVERVVIPLVTDADELARMRAAAGSRGHADGAARLVDLVEDAAATGGRA